MATIHDRQRMKGFKVILLAEDEENDVFMMRRAVQKMNLALSLQVAAHGEEAIEYLSGKNQFADRTLFPIPDLILLDINMPRKNGFDVLDWPQKDGTLTHIPAVMITSSKVKSDVDKARELGAVSYLLKPVPFDVLKALFSATEEFIATHTI
jgi:CheY-like chemotaxis protein